MRLGAADAEVAAASKAAADSAEVQAAKTDEAAAAAAAAGASGFTHFQGIATLALAGVGFEAVKLGMSFQKQMELLVTQAGVPERRWRD